MPKPCATTLQRGSQAPLSREDSNAPCSSPLCTLQLQLSHVRGSAPAQSGGLMGPAMGMLLSWEWGQPGGEEREEGVKPLQK